MLIRMTAFFAARFDPLGTDLRRCDEVDLKPRQPFIFRHPDAGRDPEGWERAAQELRHPEVLRISAAATARRSWEAAQILMQIRIYAAASGRRDLQKKALRPLLRIASA
jgi:hypothetical protein